MSNIAKTADRSELLASAAKKEKKLKDDLYFCIITFHCHCHFAFLAVNKGILPVTVHLLVHSPNSICKIKK